MRSQSKVMAIAWREFRQTVLRKAFLIAILGIPLLIVAIGAVTGLVIATHEEPPLIGTVAIVDETGQVAGALRVALDKEAKRSPIEDIREQAEEILEGNPAFLTPGDMPTLRRGEIRIDVEPVSGLDEAGLEDLRQRVRSGGYLAAAVVPELLLEAPSGTGDRDEDGRTTFELYVSPDLDNDHTTMIERRVGDAIVDVRVDLAGGDVKELQALLRRPRSQTKRVLESGEEANESADMRELKQIVPMFFMLLLWIATFSSGQHLMMSTIEEKSNRVMEVLLSTVSPLQLMAGKILGQGCVGLVIVTIYASLAVAGLVAFTLMHLIEVMDLVYLGVYFFIAYFMVASIMAAVGSAVSDIREANTLLTPVMIVLMAPLMLWLPISHDPNGAVATAFSFVPPAIPFAMILRLAADEPVPTWQIPATMVWGTACVLGMIWMAAKIFRVGVLMYGKPPGPLQLLKWLRYS